MMNFAEWLRNIEMISESKADQKRLKKMLSNAVWTDNHGVIGRFDKSVEGSKENKIYINHPVVGQVMITPMLPHFDCFHVRWHSNFGVFRKSFHLLKNHFLNKQNEWDLLKLNTLKESLENPIIPVGN